MESKKEICNLLLPVLQATRDLSDLASLDYVYDEEGVCAKEYVYAEFICGHIFRICILGGSGTEMITTIINELA